jgi:hypothetical protein
MSMIPAAVGGKKINPPIQLNRKHVPLQKKEPFCKVFCNYLYFGFIPANKNREKNQPSAVGPAAATPSGKRRSS